MRSRSAACVISLRYFISSISNVGQWVCLHFNSKSASWQATRITFGDELRESGEKDPNIEAVGIGGQIYGKRADMIIVDDAVTLSNANDFERQIKWLTQDVRSRLNPTGKLIIIGTRVASVDLYRELRQEDRYPGGLVPWTYLAMPALLTADENPDKWETLWPFSDAPFDGQEDSDKNEDGLYPRWSGRNLYNERQAMDASTWALVYQQQDISENSAFDPVCVRGSIDGMRKSGALVAGHPGHPRDLSGFSIICGLDPAMIGDTAAVCYAIDRNSNKRYIVDAIKLNVHDSPKLIISTNYAIKGEGNSHDRRRFEVEIAQYYGSKLTPEDEFKRQLFDDWDLIDFQKFDNYMVNCLQKFLKNGLIKQNAKNIKGRFSYSNDQYNQKADWSC